MLARAGTNVRRLVGQVGWPSGEVAAELALYAYVGASVGLFLNFGQPTLAEAAGCGTYLESRSEVLSVLTSFLGCAVMRTCVRTCANLHKLTVSLESSTCRNVGSRRVSRESAVHEGVHQL